MLINRRHIRIKTMQAIYAMQKKNSDNLNAEIKLLNESIYNIEGLYSLMMSIFSEIHKTEETFLDVSSKKHLATKEEKNPNKNFVNNTVIKSIINSETLNEAWEKHHTNYFYLNDNYIRHILEKIKASDLYNEYMSLKKPSFKEEQDFVVNIFKEIIAPDDNIYSAIEDCKLTWIDDFPVVNTIIYKQLSSLTEKNHEIKVMGIFSNAEDQDFMRQLFSKTVLNKEKITNLYADKIKGWSLDRIADIDLIILNLAISELIYFPSIPVKVTINEYLDIAREYSSDKSRSFINGILNTVITECTENKTINKIGRGLMQ